MLEEISDALLFSYIWSKLDLLEMLKARVSVRQEKYIEEQFCFR